MGARPIFALLSLFFTAGAIVLILLTLLAGTVDSNATNPVYFLQADTSNIPNAPATSRWTFWNYCDSDSSSARELCNGISPAFPLDPPSGRNFGTEDGVPAQFIGTRKFFYLTRFMFAFVLIGIFFAACSLLTGLLALCTRIGAFISGALNMMGLFFQMLTAILMTVAYVQGRDAFRSNGNEANIGRYSFGFMWGAFAALLLSTVLFCLAGSSDRNKRESTTSYSSKKSFFGRRNRSTRSRGSLRKDLV